jgi:hypothetical protein
VITFIHFILSLVTYVHAAFFWIVNTHCWEMGMLLLSSNSHEICCCYYWAISVISGIDIFYKIINCFSFLKLIINYFSLPAFESGAAVPAVRGESGSESDGYLVQMCN